MPSTSIVVSLVTLRCAVRRGLTAAPRAADVLIALTLRADRERALGLIHARHRNGVEQVARQDAVVRCGVLHVDGRRLPRHGHRLFDGAEASYSAFTVAVKFEGRSMASWTKVVNPDSVKVTL